jgi:hypothetical protein
MSIGPQLDLLTVTSYRDTSTKTYRTSNTTLIALTVIIHQTPNRNDLKSSNKWPSADQIWLYALDDAKGRSFTGSSAQIFAGWSDLCLN